MNPVIETIKLTQSLCDLDRAKTEEEVLLYLQACRFLTAFYRNQEVMLNADTERINRESSPVEEDSTP